ncbi:hypothetical protein B566_EDAN011954 [Ephemera danica]|nr:hypothetical protein B566_EDAN011954 [Ephemera danica]
MEPTKQQIQELRQQFFQKLEEEGPPEEGFHPVDLARVRHDDDWLQRFLLHHDLDTKEALKMLWDTCEWRKRFGTNDITESNVEPLFKEEGGLFAHNRDKDGRSLLIFRCRMHTKGQHDLHELKRFVVYWFERLERQDKGEPISLFFDMSDCGISNMDMEFTKYLIGLFKHYYPYYLNYIIVYDMAWVLNAAFKIIKSWLPARAVEKIKFVSKNTIQEYVPLDQALVSWGGTDEYEYSFEPELSNGRLEDGRKKVHFAESSNDQNSRESANLMLSISPHDTINFINENGDLNGSLTLTNISNRNVSFKIKTTSPEKFRVRPSTGILAPQATSTINVLLQPGYQTSALARDKFLVMAVVADAATDLAELWKSGGNGPVEQHRLRCSIDGNSGVENVVAMDGHGTQGGAPDINKQMADLSRQISRIIRGQEELQNSLSYNRTLLYLTLGALVVLIAAVWFALAHKSTLDTNGLDSHKMYSSSDDCLE